MHNPACVGGGVDGGVDGGALGMWVCGACIAVVVANGVAVCVVVCVRVGITECVPGAYIIIVICWVIFLADVRWVDVSSRCS